MLRDAGGQSIEVTPGTVAPLLALVARDQDTVPAAAHCRDLFPLHLYRESCVPPELPAVIRGCVRAGVLAECGDGRDGAWELARLPQSKRIVRWLRFAAIAALGSLPALLVTRLLLYGRGRRRTRSF